MRRLTFVILIALVCGPVRAQDFEEWLRQQQKAYEQYIDEQDKAFLAFLEKEWKEVELDAPTEPEPLPGPPVIPEVDPMLEDDLPPPDPAHIIREEDLPDPEPPAPPEEGEAPEEEPIPEEDTAPVPPESDREEPEPAPGDEPAPIPAGEAEPAVTMMQASLPYYGSIAEVPYDPAMVVPLAGAPSNESIAAYWLRLSATHYKPTLESLLKQRERLQLNDWGYYLLVHDLAKQLNRSRSNEVALFTWFVMTKSGYAARVGYNDRDVMLMLPSEHIVFKLPQLWFDDTRFYLLREEGASDELGSLYTYEGSYPDADRIVSFSLASLPRLTPRTATRDVSFKFKKQEYTVPVAYDENVIDFLATYPQMELGIYFGSGLSPATERSLVEGLRPLLVGKDEVQAVNLLLRFVQRGFRYKTDLNNFGRERFLFPEETLFYPYSDCEDRAILFSNLVRRMLKLDVVGLDYRRHVATAVRLESDLEGDSIMFDDARYLIADPTYFGADAGMAMPDFKDDVPKVIAAMQ